MPTYRRAKLKIPKGAKALDVVLRLPLVFPRLSVLRFTVYSPRDGARKRIARAHVTSTKAKAKEFVHHDAKRNRKIRVSVDRLADRLPKVISELSTTQALGVDSICWMRDGSVRFIPMMDFKPRPGPANLRLIRRSLLEIGQSGLLLESGASYHFYGFKLLHQKDWFKFLGDSLLLEYSDSRWIGHSLLQRNCILRLTASKKKPMNPIFRTFVG
jgi:hypothetical protein